MHLWQIAMMSVAGVLMAASGADAQNLTIQQPVVSGFSMGTTVSVPDRGGAFLGGISRGGATRTDFGPLHFGSSVGVFREQSTASTHVTIHDLGAMDRAILGQASGVESSHSRRLEQNGGQRGSHDLARSPNSPPIVRRASRAYRQLLERQSAHDSSARQPSSVKRTQDRPHGVLRQPPVGQTASVPHTVRDSTPDERQTSAARSYQLGQDAEKRGQTGLARLHYRHAAKRGSLRAAERLETLWAGSSAGR